MQNFKVWQAHTKKCGTKTKTGGRIRHTGRSRIKTLSPHLCLLCRAVILGGRTPCSARLRAPERGEIHSPVCRSPSLQSCSQFSLSPSPPPSSPEEEAQHLFYLLQERPQLELGVPLPHSLPLSHPLRLCRQQGCGWGEGRTAALCSDFPSRKPSLAELLKGEAGQPGKGKQRAQTKGLDIEGQ